jgi:hypothetical protein
MSLKKSILLRWSAASIKALEGSFKALLRLYQALFEVLRFY